MWMFLWSFNFCNFIKMNMLTNHLVANISSCPQPNPVIWIYNTFNQCVYNFKSELGLCLGLVSICCWMSAGFPQVISNFRQKKVHEAWSIYSLLLWLCGDSCNLIGCILIKQFPVQLYTSCYYVTMDIIIISQFFYCLYLHRLQEQPGRDTFRGVANQPWSPRTHRRGTIILTCVFTALLSLPKLGFHDNDKTEVFKSRKLLEVEFTKWVRMTQKIQPKKLFEWRHRLHSWSLVTSSVVFLQFSICRQEFLKSSKTWVDDHKSISKYR